MDKDIFAIIAQMDDLDRSAETCAGEEELSALAGQLEKALELLMEQTPCTCAGARAILIRVSDEMEFFQVDTARLGRLLARLGALSRECGG